MPRADVDLVESDEAGYIDVQLEDWSREIDDRLRKRYAVPFTSPPPRIILRWLTVIVTPAVYRKRGANPNDPTLELFEKDKADALAELREAADSQNGLFEIPLRDDEPQGSGVTKASPRAYTETSPYVWQDAQAEVGRQEDGYRRGT